MRHKPLTDTRFFFATAPLPCPYLPNRIERRVVTELFGRDAGKLHDQLTHAGFRRSHGIVYAPACSGCSACKAVRIISRDFTPSKSFARILKRNDDLTVEICEPVADEEQYRLFVAYQSRRHAGGDMAKMDYLDYQALIEDTPVETVLIKFRDKTGRLFAALLADRLQDGLSAVYSFFTPNQQDRSLGTYMILWLVEKTRSIKLSYVYLGFWIDGCGKMSYKARFKPLEIHTVNGWRPLKDPGIADAAE
ncbi:MAG: arginyltransferase [Rhodospirillaceae bacterium]